MTQQAAGQHTPTFPLPVTPFEAEILCAHDYYVETDFDDICNRLARPRGVVRRFHNRLLRARAAKAEGRT